jgi:hypothetical protein
MKTQSLEGILISVDNPSLDKAERRARDGSSSCDVIKNPTNKGKQQDVFRFLPPHDLIFSPFK